MNEDLPEVPPEAVAAIGQMMTTTGQQTIAKLAPDEGIKNTPSLIEGLKNGRVPGTAIVEWRDEKGPLQVNVIDFLMQPILRATDPASGQTVRVKSSAVPDGTWRCLH